MTDTIEHKNKFEVMLVNIKEELTQIALYDTETNNWEAIPIQDEMIEADENTEADVVEDWNERRALVSVLETDYRNAVRALEKINNGTYGMCEMGTHPIEEKRLNVNPTARTCTHHMDDESSLDL